MRLPPGEPPAGPWAAVPAADLAAWLLDGAVPGRPWVVAVDGRGGAGKTTTAQLLVAHLQPAAVVHTDDLAWHEPFFGWGHLARHVLETLHRGEPVSFQPPAWPAHGRDGRIEVPAGLRAVVLEGTGAAQRSYAHLVDRTVWVQADHDQAEERGIARDIAQGVNGDPQKARRFWHEWMSHELPFLADEQPWQRADVVVAGTPVTDLAPGELACAPGPLVRQPPAPG